MIALRADALVQASSEQNRRHTSIEETKYIFTLNDNFKKKKLIKHKWVYHTGSKLSSRRLPAKITVETPKKAKGEYKRFVIQFLFISGHQYSIK